MLSHRHTMTQQEPEEAQLRGENNLPAADTQGEGPKPRERHDGTLDEVAQGVTQSQTDDIDKLRATVTEEAQEDLRLYERIRAAIYRMVKDLVEDFDVERAANLARIAALEREVSELRAAATAGSQITEVVKCLEKMRVGLEEHVDAKVDQKGAEVMAFVSNHVGHVQKTLDTTQADVVISCAVTSGEGMTLDRDIQYGFDVVPNTVHEKKVQAPNDGQS